MVAVIALTDYWRLLHLVLVIVSLEPAIVVRFLLHIWFLQVAIESNAVPLAVWRQIIIMDHFVEIGGLISEIKISF